MQNNRLEYKKVKTFSTPRRLAVQIHDLAKEQTTITEEVRGPQKKLPKMKMVTGQKRRLDLQKGKVKRPEDIYVKEIKGTTYIFVEKTTEGKKAQEILPSFQEIIQQFHFPQTMRWGSDNYRFASLYAG